MTHPTPLDGIDHILAELPSSWVVGWLDDGRLVIGPAGAFVLMPGQLDLAGTADRAQDLAVRTRTVLAHHISWIPFIDAAVVTMANRPAVSTTSAIVVPVDLLGELLVGGPPVIDDPALAVLADLLAQGQLDQWRSGLAPTDVKIDLCEPQPDAPRGAHL